MGAETGKSTWPLDRSRAPMNRYCTPIGCPPTFFTVKTPVVGWFIVGDTGERASSERSESRDGVLSLRTTVTTTGALVVVTPDVLRARAENEWLVPLASEIVSNCAV